MSAASVYQQLRGHLAYLKLAAAAEALPGELDHATSTQLSHTAFLERLLAVEVAATAQRRHASLERFASLPAAWRLDDFDYDAQPSVDRTLVNELSTLRFLDDATNILFIGPPGVGKTMLDLWVGHRAAPFWHRIRAGVAGLPCTATGEVAYAPLEPRPVTCTCAPSANTANPPHGAAGAARQADHASQHPAGLTGSTPRRTRHVDRGVERHV